jgi:hypothetical protein
MKKNKLKKIEEEIKKKSYHNINDLVYYLELPQYIIRDWSKEFDILPHSPKSKTNKYWSVKAIRKFMLAKKLKQECMMTNAGIRSYLNNKRRYTIVWRK